MILSEFGSTGIEEIFVFQALSAGNGMNPFRSAPRPVSIPAHVPLCAKLSLESKSSERPMRVMTCRVCIERFPIFRVEGATPLPPLERHDNSQLCLVKGNKSAA